MNGKRAAECGGQRHSEQTNLAPLTCTKAAKRGTA